MICKKCGSVLPDDSMFCENCGTKLEVESQNVQQSNVQQSNFQQNSENQPDMTQKTEISDKKPKNKKKRNIIIASVAGGIIVAGAAVGFAFKDQIANWWKKTTMDEKEYLTDTVDKSVDNFLGDSSVLSSFSQTMDILSSDKWTAEVSVDAEVGKEMYKLLKDNGADEEVISRLDWLESGKVTLDVARDKANFKVGATANLNSTDIVSANAIYDTEDEYLYLSVPEMNNKAIRMDAPLDELIDNGDMSELQATLQEFERMAELMPDEEVAKRLIKRYLNCILNADIDVEEEEEKVSVEGVSQKVTKSTIKVSEKTMVAVMVKVLEEAKDDEDIKNIIMNMSEISGVDGKEAYRNFENSIESTLESAPDASDLSSSAEGEIHIYIDDKGYIVGIGVEADGGELRFITVTKGDKFATELKLKADGQNISLTGSGTDKKDKITSEFYVKYMGMKLVKISFNDVDSKKWESGQFNGKMTVELCDDAKSMLGMSGLDSDAIDLVSELKIELVIEENRIQLGAYKGNDKLVSVGLSDKLTSDASIKIPTKYVTVEEDDPEEWLENLDFDKVFDNLEKSGCPWTDDLERLLDMAMY